MADMKVNEQSRSMNLKRSADADEEENELGIEQSHTKEKSTLFKAKELTRAQNRCREIMQRYMGNAVFLN